MSVISRLLIPGSLVIGGMTEAAAQFPSLYFRADPFLRVDLARLQGGTSFGVSVHEYSADAYFDGRDKTPHSSKVEFPSLRYERKDIVITGVFGVSRNSAAIVSVPVSHVTQRNAETGDWGIDRVWLGLVQALDKKHRASLVMSLAMQLADPVGDLAMSVGDAHGSGIFSAQLALTNAPVSRGLTFYLRAGAGVHLRKDRWFNRRLFEFPGEFRVALPLTRVLEIGGGVDGHFIIGHNASPYAMSSYSAHDAFALGPDLVFRLTDFSRVHAVYREELFGYYASAGSYWNVSMHVAP